MRRAMSLAKELQGLAFLLPVYFLRVSEAIERIEAYLGVLLSYFMNCRWSQEGMSIK